MANAATVRRAGGSWPRRAVFALALVAAIAAKAVRADVEDVDDDEEEEFEDAPIPGGATGDEAEKLSALLKIRDNLRVSTLFPHALFGNLESGRYAEILINADNGADLPINIATIEGSFRAVADYSFVMQNFTTYRYDVSIPPGEQASMTYRWPIGAVYEPVDLRLEVLLTVVTPHNQAFKYPAFNATVTVVDPVQTGFDWQTLFVYVILLGLLGLVGYGVYNMFIAKRLAGATKAKRAAAPAAASGSKGKAESGASNRPEVDMSWIPKEQLKMAAARKR